MRPPKKRENERVSVWGHTVVNTENAVVEPELQGSASSSHDPTFELLR